MSGSTAILGAWTVSMAGSSKVAEDMEDVGCAPVLKEGLTVVDDAAWPPAHPAADAAAFAAATPGNAIFFSAGCV